MNLEWQKPSVKGRRWQLVLISDDDDDGMLMAIVDPRGMEDTHRIIYWTSVEDMDSKSVDFDGSQDDAKAYALALVRVG